MKNHPKDVSLNGLLVRVLEAMDSWFSIDGHPSQRIRWSEAKVPMPARPSLAV
jgi:hypothetical protein